MSNIKIKRRGDADDDGVVLAQARVDAERWVDEGGGYRAEPAARYRCPCQHVFQVFGLGRHRRYYELADREWERPLMGRACPSCQRRLPGKN